MAIMRNTLLWASRNNWLKKHVPRWGFVKRAVRQYMPGDQIEDALVAANKLDDKGIKSTFTALGEEVTDVAEAEKVAQSYLDAYDDIDRIDTDTEISVKLTHLGLDVDADRTASHVDALAARAKRSRGWLWIDMEASEYVERTLDICRTALANHSNVGVCVQAYLHRTPKDIEDLISLGAGIRLVKGAYKESEDIAATDREEVDLRFVRMGKTLLDHATKVRVALASHDVDLLDELTAYAESQSIAKEHYEIQMLYGIRVEDQERIADEGYVMRTLVAYGDGWYPWYVRRLAERPANLGFVVRSVFSRG